MSNEHQLQTSVFINSGTTNNNQARPPRGFTESVSARPLLTSTASTTKPSTPRIQLIMRSLSTKALVITALVVALVIAVIVVVVLFARPKPGTNSETSGIPTCASVNSILTVDNSDMCNKPTTISKSCNQAGSWGIYDVNDAGWENAAKYLPPPASQLTSLVLSPAFEISSDIYSLEVQFSFASDSEFTVYIVTSDHTIFLPVSSGPCHVGLVADSIVLNESSFRIVIGSPTSIQTTGASASVNTSPFRRFESLGITPEVTAKPEFAVVEQGTQNLCTLEIYNQRTVDCDWWIVDDVSSFEKLETHSCVGNGLQSRPGETWFLALESPFKAARALLISPVIMKGEDTHVLFTIWHMIKCTGTQIRVFMVTSSQEVATITADSKPVAEIRNGSADFAWQFKSFQIRVPPSYESFQLVVEGVVAADGNCSHFLCSSSRGSAFESVTPLLVLDDLAVEMRHDRCNLTGKQNLTMLDCRFQDLGNTSTYCNWESSNDSPMHGDYFQDWKTDNSGDGQEILHGATSEHLDGRGHILSFDALGKAGDSGHFSSPVVTANSNCSCTMSFLYLLRGPLTPRLQVDLVIGSDTTNEDRTRLPQWSLYGHQSDDWQLGRVVLNLNTDTAFQIEIVVKDIRDSRGDIHIDDLFFYQCDFQLYNQ